MTQTSKGKNVPLTTKLVIELDKRTKKQLNRIEAKLDALLQGELLMSLDLEDLKAAAQAETEVTASAIALLNDISGRLAQSAGDEAAVREIAANLRDNASQLANAVIANTPSDPSGGAQPPADTGDTGTVEQPPADVVGDVAPPTTDPGVTPDTGEQPV